MRKVRFLDILAAFNSAGNALRKFYPFLNDRVACVQLGFLVIALPSLYEGGQLTVERSGIKQTFDWSTNYLPLDTRLQWGAFYSDCKHEVHQVTSGFQFTVTYILKPSRGPGAIPNPIYEYGPPGFGPILPVRACFGPLSFVQLSHLDHWREHGA